MKDCIVHISDRQITNRKAVATFFSDLKDGKYLLSAKNIRKRSNNQNAYLHGVVIPLVFEGLRNNGFDDVRDHEDAKLIIKTLFLKRSVTNGLETIEIVRGTSELTTSEMMEFISEVQKWASEYLNVYIPDPNQQSVMFATYDNSLNATIISNG